MVVQYIRVSTVEQNEERQVRALIEKGVEPELPYCEKKGYLFNSDEFDGLEMHEGLDAIVAKYIAAE